MLADAGPMEPAETKKGPQGPFFNDLQESLWIYIWSGKRDVY